MSREQIEKQAIEELAKYLFEFAPILSERNCHYVAERAYKEGYRKQEWNSVEERLPEKYQDVLVYRDSSFDIDFVISEGRFCIDGVTHWMPLPEPPMMKGNEKE